MLRLSERDCRGEIIKAISIREPFASMILKGEKTIETRTWKTKYRGWLLLCASQKPKSDISGNAFALAYLNECRLMTWGDQTKACCAVFEGAWAWVLSEVHSVKPFPVKGQLRLFNVQFYLAKVPMDKLKKEGYVTIDDFEVEG